MAIVIGLDAKLYIDDEASYVSPTWAEVTNVKDLTLSVEKNKVDVTVRGNNGWRAWKTVLKDASPKFNMNWDTEDDNFQAIKDAFFNGTALNVAIMDGDIATPGSEGLKGPMEVVSFTRNEQLEEALTVDVELAPAQVVGYTTDWYVVT